MNISSKGMSPVLDKVQAIQEAPAPQDLMFPNFHHLSGWLIITRGIYFICHLFLHLFIFFWEKNLHGLGKRSRKRHLRKPMKCFHQICYWSIVTHQRSWFDLVILHPMGLEPSFHTLCLQGLNSQLLMLDVMQKGSVKKSRVSCWVEVFRVTEGRVKCYSWLFTADSICEMIEFLIDNIFVQFGGRLSVR